MGVESGVRARIGLLLFTDPGVQGLNRPGRRVQDPRRGRRLGPPLSAVPASGVDGRDPNSGSRPGCRIPVRSRRLPHRSGTSRRTRERRGLALISSRRDRPASCFVRPSLSRAPSTTRASPVCRSGRGPGFRVVRNGVGTHRVFRLIRPSMTELSAGTDCRCYGPMALSAASSSPPSEIPHHPY